MEVKTYIQSWNLLFHVEEPNTIRLTEVILTLIEKTFRFQTDVILTRHVDKEDLVNTSLLLSSQSQEKNKYYISFLKSRFPGGRSIPLFSNNKDVGIIYQHNMYLKSISTVYKGKYGFPNSFIEKPAGIPSANRNPN